MGKNVGYAMCAVVFLLSTNSATAEDWKPTEEQVAAAAARRKAAMVKLRFQNALAEERWKNALSLCSARVREKAAKESSLKDFFHQTMPVTRVAMPAGFSPYKEQLCTSYSFLVKLAGPHARQSGPPEPTVHWNWHVTLSDGKWTVDWAPSPFNAKELIAKVKAENEKRRQQRAKIRREMEPILRGIKTHLTAVSNEFVIGSPMLFKVELMNLGSAPIHYENTGTQHFPLIVLNERREVVPAFRPPAQVGVSIIELAPGSTEPLTGKVDITKTHEIARPGKHFVQFDGRGVDIGEKLPGPKNSDGTWDESLVTTTTRFPSNILEIEVRSDRKED